MPVLVPPLGLAVLGLGLPELGLPALGLVGFGVGVASFVECPWAEAWWTGRLTGLVTARPLNRSEPSADVDVGADVGVEATPLECVDEGECREARLLGAAVWCGLLLAVECEGTTTFSTGPAPELEREPEPEPIPIEGIAGRLTPPPESRISGSAIPASTSAITGAAAIRATDQTACLLPRSLAANGLSSPSRKAFERP